MSEKVQTGLRVPEMQYNRLQEMSGRMGISLNALTLMLVDIGLTVLTLGTEEERRLLLRNCRDNA